MTASQAMSRRVRCLRPLERAGAVFDTLNACQHDCFPVVDDEGGDVLVGTILRWAREEEERCRKSTFDFNKIK